MILSLKAGMSSGLRLVVSPLSTTTSSSTQLAPAVRKSVFRLRQLHLLHAVGGEEGDGLAVELAHGRFLSRISQVVGTGATRPVNTAASEAAPGRVRARTRRSVAVDVGGLLDDLEPAPEARGV